MSANSQAVLPSGWALTTLGALTQPSRPRHSPQGYPELPFIGMEHIEAHTMRLLNTVPAKTMKSSAVHFFAGDVLYGRLRPYLNKVYCPDFEGLCSGEFIVFPDSDYLVSKFLQHFVNSSAFVSFASHLNEGDRPRVDFGQLASYTVRLPPLNEQHRIVAEIEKHFTRLDAAVNALKRIQANLKRYRASVLKAACEGRLVPIEAERAKAEGRDYESADQLLPRILKERRAKWEADQLAKMKAQGKTPKDDKWKDKYVKPALADATNLPGLQQGWTVASLEQLTSAVRVICYGILMPKENVKEGVLFVKVKDMKGDKIDVSSLHKTSKEIAAAYARASLKAGDLLLAIRGTYGRIAEVPTELEGGNITQDTARLDVSNLIDHRYIAIYLRSIDAQNYFKRVARGVAVKGVNIADVRLTPILLPPFDEQKRIVSEVERHLSIIEELETVVEANLRRAERLRQSILKRAFEGKLVPQDPTDEPASNLLERIRAGREKKLSKEKVQKNKRRAGKSGQPKLDWQTPEENIASTKAQTNS